MSRRRFVFLSWTNETPTCRDTTPYIIMFYYNDNKFVEWYIIPQISRKTIVHVILKPYYTADIKMKKNPKL